MDKILITPRYLSRNGHESLQAFRDNGFDLLIPWPGRQPEHDELSAILPECTGYLAGLEPITADILCRAQRLKVICRYGVGLDNVDLEAAAQSHIRVLGTPGTNAEAVAELSLMFIIALLRNVWMNAFAMKNGIWQRTKGTEASGRTLGIIGCGHVGWRLANMATGMGMKVIGCDPHPDEYMRKLPGFRFADIADLQRYADVISLNCPLTPEPIIDRKFIAACRRGVCIVNTARALLVDEPSLLEALESGMVSGYATDVYATEPPELTPLYQHERVFLTPHIGALTDESVDRTIDAAVKNMLDVLCECHTGKL